MVWTEGDVGTVEGSSGDYGGGGRVKRLVHRLRPCLAGWPVPPRDATVGMSWRHSPKSSLSSNSSSSHCIPPANSPHPSGDRRSCDSASENVCSSTCGTSTATGNSLMGRSHVPPCHRSSRHAASLRQTAPGFPSRCKPTIQSKHKTTDFQQNDKMRSAALTDLALRINNMTISTKLPRLDSILSFQWEILAYNIR